MINIFISDEYWRYIAKIDQTSLDIMQNYLAEEGIKVADCKVFANSYQPDGTLWVTGDNNISGIRMKEERSVLNERHTRKNR